MTTPTPGRDAPEFYRPLAAGAVKSRANAVKLFCLECVGYARVDVTNCTATQCPLYRWRPYQAKPARAANSRAQPIQLQRKRAGSDPSTGQTGLDAPEGNSDVARTFGCAG